MSSGSGQAIGGDRGTQLVIVDEGQDQFSQILSFDHRRDQRGFDPVADDFPKTTSAEVIKADPPAKASMAVRPNGSAYFEGTNAIAAASNAAWTTW